MHELICLLKITLFLFKGIAFRVSENEEFKNFFKYLSEHNVEFKIPSRRAISAQIKKLAKDKREDLKKILVKPDIIAIATDAWTSTKPKIGYLGY